MANAQQRLKEIAAQEQALADEKKKLLDASKEEDLKTVRELCKQHGFTATQLRGYLRSKGKAKAGSAARKPAAKKTAKAN
jgi:phage antirepressor YoqD-like protein